MPRDVRLGKAAGRPEEAEERTAQPSLQLEEALRELAPEQAHGQSPFEVVLAADVAVVAEAIGSAVQANVVRVLRDSWSIEEGKRCAGHVGVRKGNAAKKRNRPSERNPTIISSAQSAAHSPR
jgi:hypothetical protein